jgi:hypothetical protein
MRVKGIASPTPVHGSLTSASPRTLRESNHRVCSWPIGCFSQQRCARGCAPNWQPTPACETHAHIMHREETISRSKCRANVDCIYFAIQLTIGAPAPRRRHRFSGARKPRRQILQIKFSKFIISGRNALSRAIHPAQYVLNATIYTLKLGNSRGLRHSRENKCIIPGEAPAAVATPSMARKVRIVRAIGSGILNIDVYRSRFQEKMKLLIEKCRFYMVVSLPKKVASNFEAHSKPESGRYKHHTGLCAACTHWSTYNMQFYCYPH